MVQGSTVQFVVCLFLRESPKHLAVTVTVACDYTSLSLGERESLALFELNTRFFQFFFCLFS